MTDTQAAQLEQDVNAAMAGALAKANARIVRQSKVIKLLLTALNEMDAKLDRLQSEAE